MNRPLKLGTLKPKVSTYEEEEISKTDRPMLTLDQATTQKYMTFTNFNYRRTYR